MQILALIIYCHLKDISASSCCPPSPARQVKDLGSELPWLRSLCARLQATASEILISVIDLLVPLFSL